MVGFQTNQPTFDPFTHLCGCCGVTNIQMDPFSSQQSVSLHHSAFQPKEEEARPRARFKPILS